jgi:hypothetical protein
LRDGAPATDRRDPAKPSHRGEIIAVIHVAGDNDEDTSLRGPVFMLWRARPNRALSSYPLPVA